MFRVWEGRLLWFCSVESASWDLEVWSLSPLRGKSHLPFECLGFPTLKNGAPMVCNNLPSIGIRSTETPPLRGIDFSTWFWSNSQSLGSVDWLRNQSIVASGVCGGPLTPHGGQEAEQ